MIETSPGYETTLVVVIGAIVAGVAALFWASRHPPIRWWAWLVALATAAACMLLLFMLSGPVALLLLGWGRE